MRRIVNCLKRGHDSILEHAYMTFNIEGVSRITTHQLVRHRMASYVEKSLRYTKVSDDDFFITPEEIEGACSLRREYRDVAKLCYELYQKMVQCGVSPDEARYILPMGTKTDIVVTMNMREFFHFLDLRLDKAANIEMQTLAMHMLARAIRRSPTWEKFLTTCYISLDERRKTNLSRITA